MLRGQHWQPTQMPEEGETSFSATQLLFKKCSKPKLLTRAGGNLGISLWRSTKGARRPHGQQPRTHHPTLPHRALAAEGRWWHHIRPSCQRQTPL